MLYPIRGYALNWGQETSSEPLALAFVKTPAGSRYDSSDFAKVFILAVNFEFIISGLVFYIMGP